LNGRFTHRVTTVTGAAGFGKTTAMALAVENNRLDPVGRDVWLALTPNATSALGLINGLAAALDIEPGGGVGSTTERITDAVWSAAPDDVVLIIDDLHLADNAATSALGDLLTALPENLLEIDEGRLALDDELSASTAREIADGATQAPNNQHLPRHVATADLQLAAGLEAGADFMWEEVLSGPAPDRLATLHRCSVLDGLPLVEWSASGRRMHTILR
jgi:LuxR family maltose regulon positive regulatory protein